MTGRGGRLLLVAVAALVIAPWAPAGPGRAAGESNCVHTKPGVLAGTPWSLRRIQPERVWGLTTGKGVLVAVIDTGVDVRHPQLKGQVIGGPDVLGKPGGPSTADCSGHGTGVAGIIVARPLPGLLFHGVAPGARVYSIRQTDQPAFGPKRGTAAGMATAIRLAVRARAKVINISATTPVDVPVLRAAVAFAMAHDVVVVAAAGNDDPNNPTQDDPNAIYYPAAYPGVLAVASSDRDDKRADQSHAASYVKVAAPGKDVDTTGPNGGSKGLYVTQSGTSFAAPYVAGTVALVRAYYPHLSGAQVVARIMNTADVPPVGVGGAKLGAGIVNPYHAVTAVIPAEGAAAARSPAPLQAAVPVSRPALDHRVRDRALAAAAVAGVLALLIAVVAAVIPRGRAGRWRPGRAGGI